LEHESGEDLIWQRFACRCNGAQVFIEEPRSGNRAKRVYRTERLKTVRGLYRTVQQRRQVDFRDDLHRARQGFFTILACLTIRSQIPSLVSFSKRNHTQRRKHGVQGISPHARLGRRSRVRFLGFCRAAPRASETCARLLGLLSRGLNGSVRAGSCKRAKRWQGAVEPQQRFCAKADSARAWILTQDLMEYSVGQRTVC
jgi:hypothetical protein